jgi:superfamily I DNA/RNA helicase
LQFPGTGLLGHNGPHPAYRAGGARRPAVDLASTRAEIEAVIARQLAMRRQRHGADNHDFAAMTVQQAKNREFEGVVVLWPYQVGGDAEHKRRLLYNAITRARRWCTIVVQNPNLLQDAPF